MQNNFPTHDLSFWMITSPVEGDDGKPLEKKDDLKTTDEAWFFHGPNGEMVFTVPHDGYTTAGSDFPRSELRERELKDDGSGTVDRTWTIDEGGMMTATLSIQSNGSETGNGDEHVEGNGLEDRLNQRDSVIVGQIHGDLPIHLDPSNGKKDDEELIRLYYGFGQLWFQSDVAGPNDEELTFFLYDDNGNKPDIGLNDVFSYKIEVANGSLTVIAAVDGTEYSNIMPINDIWYQDELYFRAGAYFQTKSGTGDTQVSFYGLDHSHPGRNDPADGGLTPHPDVTIPSPPIYLEWPTDTTPPPPEPITGTTNDDFLSGTTADETILGLEGNDTLKGREGDDTLEGGPGNDMLEGNDGDDRLLGGPGDDTLKGGNGIDTYVFALGDSQDTIQDYRDGETVELVGTGFDSYADLQASGSVWSSGATTTVSLGGGDVLTIQGLAAADAAIAFDFVAPVEPPTIISGTPNDDVLTGGDGDEIIKGREGDDTLDGGAGNDRLEGNDGDDRLAGGAGDDTIKGGNGIDTYVFALGDGRDTIEDYRDGETVELIGFGIDDYAALQAGATVSSTSDAVVVDFGGGDVLTVQDLTIGEAPDAFAFEIGGTPGGTPPSWTDYLAPGQTPQIGSTGDDVLGGGSGADAFDGAAGDDTIKGRGGDDVLYGSDGDDYLEGNSGDDVLIGGPGADGLKGSDGADTLVYLSLADAGDNVIEFRDEDTIDLRPLFAYDLAGVDAADAFTDGYVVLGSIGNDSVLSIDPDGAAGPDGEIVLATIDGTITSADILV